MKKIVCPFCGSTQIRLEPQTPRPRNRILEMIPFLGRRRPQGRHTLTCRNCGRQSAVEL